MALLEILHYPNKRLALVAKAVKKIDQTIRQYADDMIETMYAANGIGLAATQVDIQQRIFVADTTSERNQPTVFINPTIISTKGEIEYREGCLSIPGVFGDVTRCQSLTLEAFNLEGEKFLVDATGLLAVCIQHEIDHLDGKLFIEHLSLLEQDRIKQEVQKSSPKTPPFSS